MTRKLRHRLIGAGLAVSAVGLAVLYYIVEPTSGLLPQCTMYRYTGLKCPGCGSQRFVHAALHGHWGEAFNYNYFMPVLALFLVAVIWVEFTAATHPGRAVRFYHPAVIWSLLGIMLLWTVVRNIFGL